MIYINTPTGKIPIPEPSDNKEIPKVDLSKKCVCVIDTGLATHIAQLMAKSFGRVLYHIPDSDAFKKTNKAQIGTGIPGVEKVKDLFNVVQVDQTNRIVDLFIFIDVSMIGLQRHLKALGYPVVGCFGSYQMELEKIFYYETLKSLGLPVADYEVAEGIDDLREKLNARKDFPCFVKLADQEYRGVTETFPVDDADAIDPVLDDISIVVGRNKDTIKYLTQNKIESKCETGIDTLQVNGQHSNNPLVGIEGKNEWYIAKVVPDVPKVLKEYVNKTASIFETLGMQCPRSTENRITEDGSCYGIDETIRVPEPPGALFPELYEDGDYAQAMWNLGQGIVPVLHPKEKYGVEIIMTSESLKKGLPVKVIFPPELEPFVKLTSYKIEEDGSHWVVPDNDESDFLGAVVATGKSLKEAEKKCREYAEQIKAHKLCYEGDVMTASKEAREKASKFGIDF